MADLSFLTKEKLHTGFGEEIINASSYNDVLTQAGLNWTVSAVPTAAIDSDGSVITIPGRTTILRTEDKKPLGIVSDKYKIVNNEDAFAFTESLFMSKEIEFIRGGSYHGGSATWLEAKVAGKYSIMGDELDCYLIFMNTHDGTGSVRCMIVPERIACSNALNLPLRQQSRHWRCAHNGDPLRKIEEARDLLLAGSKYMEELTKECEELQAIKISDGQIIGLINRLLPIDENMTDKQVENQELRRSQLFDVFIAKADLTEFGSTGFKFVSAVADYVDHRDGRNTANSSLNRFIDVANGHHLVDMAYNMVKSL